MSEVRFYIRRIRIISGPYSAAEMKELATAADLHAEDEVRRDGMTTWVRADKVKGLSFGTVAQTTATAGQVAESLGRAKDTAENLSSLASHITSIVSAVSGIIGAVNDFLRPLADLNLFLFAATTLCTLALLVLSATGRDILWGLPVRRLVFLMFIALITFGAWLGLGKTLGSDGQGVLATKIEIIADVQKKIFPVAHPKPPVPKPSLEDRTILDIAPKNPPKSSTTVPPISRSVDLLATADLTAKSTNGRWLRDGKVLESPTRHLSSWVTLTRPPFSQYRLDMEVERLEEGHGINIGLIVQGRRCAVVVDGFASLGGVSGLETVDGKSGSSNETTRFGRHLQINQRKALAIEVRQEGIILNCEGKQVFEWRGRAHQLSLHPGWPVPEPERMFLGSQAKFRFHKLVAISLD